MQTAIETLTDAVLDAESRGEALDPAALLFLLRRYAMTGRDDFRCALERGLTRAVALDLAASRSNLADAVQALCEAAAVTDDERVVDAVVAGAAELQRAWPSRGPVSEAMRTIEACLAARHWLTPARDAIAAAIDELERIVCLVYRPGEPLPEVLARPDAGDGSLDAHVFSSAALLAAHDATGRLPYSMLAEELMQPVRTRSDGAFATRCNAARVFCRLARLHDDPDYVAVAVIGRDCDYRAEARGIVEALMPSYRDHGAAGAIYGLALDELASAT
jgi:hypothetical protein